MRWVRFVEKRRVRDVVFAGARVGAGPGGRVAQPLARVAVVLR